MKTGNINGKYFVEIRGKKYFTRNVFPNDYYGGKDIVCDADVFSIPPKQIYQVLPPIAQSVKIERGTILSESEYLFEGDSIRVYDYHLNGYGMLEVYFSFLGKNYSCDISELWSTKFDED